MQAIKGSHLGVVKELVGAQADVNEQDKVYVVSSNLPNTKNAYKVAYTV